MIEHEREKGHPFTPWTPLCELARKHGTDKGGDHTIAGEICHTYTPIYHELFKDRRPDVKRVLEIGVNTGASLRMWAEYFSNADVIGLDIDATCMAHTAGRIHCAAADQSDPESLRAALAVGTFFDLIVDDGSHVAEHQLTSIQTLMPFLADDGVYVIEDLVTEFDAKWIAQHMTTPFAIVQCPHGRGPKRFTEKLLIARSY